MEHPHQNPFGHLYNADSIICLSCIFLQNCFSRVLSTNKQGVQSDQINFKTDKTRFYKKQLAYDPIRHPAFIKIWNIQDLRMHLAQKLAIAHSEIFVNAATNTLDVGSCNCGGRKCFPASKTPIEFSINGKVKSLSKTLQCQNSELY